MKTITLSDFLTADQISAAHDIYRNNTTNPAREISEKVIYPDMDEIDAKLGQENDGAFLGYMVSHAFALMDAAPRVAVVVPIKIDVPAAT